MTPAAIVRLARVLNVLDRWTRWRYSVLAVFTFVIGLFGCAITALWNRPDRLSRAHEEMRRARS